MALSPVATVGPASHHSPPITHHHAHATHGRRRDPFLELQLTEPARLHLQHQWLPHDISARVEYHLAPWPGLDDQLWLWSEESVALLLSNLRHQCRREKQ